MYIAACKDPSAGQRGSVHAECYKGSRKSFRVNEDLLILELPRMLNDFLSCRAMPRIGGIATALLEIEQMLTNSLAMSSYQLGLT